ncbi:MAG TPA: 3-dehydroquinate synthase [Candidatus Paceibacterota bacterium]|nr:3-dehydroquinate synthase [Verrucomicrobiota bacterium]HRY51499.1 3-dehydroquinate synthase [Candidatus Paceibacterota bacterium]
MRTVKVSLGSRSYRIRIGDDLLDVLGRECSRLDLGKRCAVITDTRVAPHYADRILRALGAQDFHPRLIVIPAGESSKSLPVVDRCYQELSDHRLDRQSFVVALGGGVVGDLAGFVAATYLRGIGFVQVPTTLLAQVDSSVGGKVGINLRSAKNLVGAFHQPKLVLTDLRVLDTLPPREFRSGLAEVIKYGVIWDPALFRLLERSMGKILSRDRAVLARVIARCCDIKAEVVTQDEQEGGLRAILNFGHTIGHGIEALAGYGRYLHGEAVAIGMVAACRLSHALTGLSRDEGARIVNLLKQAGLPVSVQLTHPRRTRLFEILSLDKKTSGGRPRFVLAHRIGHVLHGQEVPPQSIADTLASLSGSEFNSLATPSRPRSRQQPCPPAGKENDVQRE